MSREYYSTPKQAGECIETIEEAIRILNNKKKGYGVKNKLAILPQDREAIIIGDLHGDLETLCKIFEKTNFRDYMEKGGLLICLGDYIDRGPKQIELIYNMLKTLIDHPNNVILIRGNHEGPKDIKLITQSFTAKLKMRYGRGWSPVYKAFRELFDNLFTAAVVEKKVLLLHGGIPTKAKNLDDIANANLTHPMKPHLAEILWNDPSSKKGVFYSFRGTGKQFGSETASSFLDKIGVQMLIRGHECFNDGYFFHGDRVMTLFSCKLPIYRNKYAAYIQMPLNKIHRRESLREYIYTL